MSLIQKVKLAIDSLSGSAEIRDAIKDALEEIDSDLEDHNWKESDEVIVAVDRMIKIVEAGVEEVVEDDDDDDDDDDEDS